MTRDMLHEALKFNDDTQKGLSNELWAFSKDFYPRLIELTEEPAMRVASAPIILKAPENVLAVSSSFLVKYFEFLWDYSPENHVQKGEVIEESLEKMKNRKSTRLNSSHVRISYAVFCLKKKKKKNYNNNINE